MKFPTIVILLLLPFSSLSQSGLIRGVVTNEATHEPLPFASIRLQEDGSGTITNASGEFSFFVRQSAGGNLIISHLGFATQTISIHVADTTRQFTILLRPEAVQLNEVAIASETPLSIVRKCIERFTENYPTRSYAAEGFQREYVKSATNNVIQLLEANFTSSGNASDHSSVVNHGKYIEDKAEKSALWSPSRGGFYTFGWRNISAIEAPDKNNFLGINTDEKGIEKYYDFTWDKEAIENTYVIRFDQKANIRRALLKGRLYIDETSFAIVKISYELSPRGSRWLKPHETWGNIRVSQPPKKITINKDRVEISYRKFGSKWYLNNLIADASFNASVVFFGIVQGEKSALSFHSECVVTAIDTLKQGTTLSNIKKIGSIPTLQNYIKKKYESYEMKDSRWGDLNFIQSDTSFTTIATALKIKNEHWEQEVRRRLVEKHLNSTFSEREVQEDLRYLKDALEKIHPGLTLYTSKAELERQFYDASIKLKSIHGGRHSGISEAGFLKVIGPLIEKIHCGHTIVYPSIPTSEWLSLSRTAFPIQLMFAGDTAIVSSSFINVPAGSRLLSINGTAMGEIVSKLKSVIPADGANEMYKTFQLQKNFAKWLSWYYPGSDSFDIEFDTDKVIRHQRIGGVVLTDHQETAFAHFQFYDSTRTLLVTLPTFEADQGFDQLLNEAFKAAKAGQTKNVVIDLRNNEGGRDEYGALLFSFIAKNDFDYYKNILVKTADTTTLGCLSVDGAPFNKILPDYTAGIRKSDNANYYTSHSNLCQQTPDSNAFLGDVYILINGGTFSTAAEFASVAQFHRRAIFIGEESGGASYQNCSLGTPTLTLPNSKLRINIPLGMYTMAVNETQPPGHGVIPDHHVTYTTHDLLAGRDKGIELCLQLMKGTGR